MSDQPSFTVVFACGEGATPSVGESGNDFSEYRVIAIANGDYTERLNDAENLLAEGVHSCSNFCRRPMCVLRRENQELEAQVERLETAITTAIGRIDNLNDFGDIREVLEWALEQDHD